MLSERKREAEAAQLQRHETNDEDRVDELRAILQEMAGTAIGVEWSAKVTAEPGTLWSDEYGLHFDMP